MAKPLTERDDHELLAALRQPPMSDDGRGGQAIDVSSWLMVMAETLARLLERMQDEPRMGLPELPPLPQGGQDER